MSTLVGSDRLFSCQPYSVNRVLYLTELAKRYTINSDYPIRVIGPYLRAFGPNGSVLICRLAGNLALGWDRRQGGKDGGEFKLGTVKRDGNKLILTISLAPELVEA